MEKSRPSTIKVVFLSGLIISAVLFVIALVFYVNFKFDWLLSVTITVGLFLYHFGVRFFSAPLVYCITKKRFNYNSPWFREKKWERKLYRFLNMQRIKSPAMSYDPNEFSFEKHSLEEIINNTCHAELVHEVIVVFSMMSMLFSIPFGDFIVFFITAIAASLIDLYFVLVQRYNRPRLIKLLNLNKRKNETN